MVLQMAEGRGRLAVFRQHVFKRRHVRHQRGECPDKPGEIIAGIAARFGQRPRRAMAGDDMDGLERRHALEGFAPFRGVRDLIQNAQHAIHEDQITGKDRALIRQPDDGVGGEMGRAGPDDLQLDAAKLQPCVIRIQRRGGKDGFCSGKAFFQHRLEAFHVAGGEGFLAFHGAFQGDDLRSLGGEIAIAEPAVILRACVDDPFHRLARGHAHGQVDDLGAGRRRAGIDENDAILGHDDAEGGVEGEILPGARAGLADEGPDILRDAHGLENRSGLRQRRPDQGGEQKKKEGRAESHRALLVAVCGLRGWNGKRAANNAACAKVAKWASGWRKNGAPKGTRTPVSGVRGRRPRPLDDGGGALEPSHTGLTGFPIRGGGEKRKSRSGVFSPSPCRVIR